MKKTHLPENALLFFKKNFSYIISYDENHDITNSKEFT